MVLSLARLWTHMQVKYSFLMIGSDSVESTTVRTKGRCTSRPRRRRYWQFCPIRARLMKSALPSNSAAAALLKTKVCFVASAYCRPVLCGHLIGKLIDLANAGTLISENGSVVTN